MDHIEFFKNAISNIVANTHVSISLNGVPAAISVVAACATVFGVVAVVEEKKVASEQIAVRKMDAEIEMAKGGTMAA